jgi:spoIIIJ-associated protein
MRDRVFSGQDVQEALAVAATTLGLPRDGLRYVVLEAGTAAGRGLKPTPARIAVLMDEPGGEQATRADDEQGEAGVEQPADPLRALRATVHAVAAEGGLELEAEIEEDADAVVVQLKGRDVSFVLGTDGRGEVFRALEHLLQRMYGTALHPRMLRLAAEGFREGRDAALAEEARRIAAEVRRDGRARTLEPQNAYERRVVHLALRDEPGVTTFSVGEGLERRVTVAPPGAAVPPEAGPPPGAGDDGAD